MAEEHERRYAIRPGGAYFSAGVTRDGEQVLMGLFCPNLVAFFFDPDGNLLRADQRPVPSMRIAIKGDTLIRGDGGFSVESKIAIDPSKHPKAIDLVTRLPGGGSETALGIYELSGDSLEICYDSTEKQRPKEFKCAEGSTVVLSVLKRPK